MLTSKSLQLIGLFLLSSLMALVGYLNFTHQLEFNPISYFMIFAAISNLPDKYELQPEILIGWLLIITSSIITYKFSHHQMTFESSDIVVSVNLTVMYFLGWWLAGLKKLTPRR
jgi:hypothetical protein